jgi:hypothetical protein
MWKYTHFSVWQNGMLFQTKMFRAKTTSQDRSAWFRLEGANAQGRGQNQTPNGQKQTVEFFWRVTKIDECT